MIILFWMITVLSVVIDRITKYIAESGISEGQLIRAITLGDTDILAFSLHKNTGAAFSSFTGKTMALAIFNYADICVVFGAILLIVYYLFIEGKYMKRFEEEKSNEQ